MGNDRWREKGREGGEQKKNGQVLNKPQIRLFLNWSIAAQDLWRDWPEIKCLGTIERFHSHDQHLC